MNVNVLYGDRISICCERTNHVLSSRGVSDPRIVLCSPAQPGRLLHRFERCVFTVEPAVAPVLASTSSKEGMYGLSSDEAAAPRTLVSAATPQDPLMFGGLVRLRHVYSGHMVTVTRRRRSEAKPGSVDVTLDATTNDYSSSVFRVMPRYKIRQEGERVSAGDHLILFNEHLKVHLSLDQEVAEIIATPAFESFSFFLFEGSDSGRLPGVQPTTIRHQNALLLFHKEQESFFQVDESRRRLILSRPHIRDSTYNIASLRYSSNALWVVEGMNAAEGGPVATAPETVRLKHSATGLYLAASLVKGGIDLIEDPLEGDCTAWALVPCEVSERWVQSSSTYFRLQNVVTQGWLHTNVTEVADAPALTTLENASMHTLSHTTSSARAAAASYTGEMEGVNELHEDSIVRGTVALIDRPAYVDVFCAVSVSYDIEKHLHQILGYRDILEQLRDAARMESSDGLTLRTINGSKMLARCAAALEALIPFCYQSIARDRHVLVESGPSAGLSSMAAATTSPSSSSSSQRPMSRHQSMLFDQQVPLVVMDTLSFLFQKLSQSSSPPRGTSPTSSEAMASAEGAADAEAGWGAYPNLCLVIQNMFRFLKAVLKENIEVCDSLAPCLGLLTPFIPHFPVACGVFSEVSRLRVLPTDLVAEVVAIVKPVLHENVAYFSMLQALCLGAGRPNLPNQQTVFNCFADAHTQQHLTGGAERITPLIDTDESGTLVVNGSVPVAQLHLDANEALATFCSRSWKLLGACTVGRPFPHRAWVEVEQLSALLTAARGTPVLESTVAIARSVFLSDVDDAEVTHPQLWCWKYRASSTGGSAEGVVERLTTVQHVIAQHCMTMLEDLTTSYEMLKMHTATINQLLVLWNAIAITKCFLPEHTPRLVSVIGNIIESIPQHNIADGDRHVWPDHPVEVMQAVLHCLHLMQTLLHQHAHSAARRVRHLIRPQLHEEVEVDAKELHSEFRSASKSDLLCQQQWIRPLMSFASYPNERLASASLVCLFRILSPASLVQEALQATIVFSEGREHELGELLSVAQEAATLRFNPSKTNPAQLEVILARLLELCNQFLTDMTATLDAQNALQFAGVHATLLQYLDDAQRVSLGHLMGTVVERTMELFTFMTLRNGDVTRAIVKHMAQLIHLSTLCQTCPAYFHVMVAVFGAVDENITADVAKLVHDVIVSAETMCQPALEVILQVLRCKSKEIRTCGREATVHDLVSAPFLKYDAVDPSVRPLLLELVCECAQPSTLSTLCSYLSLEEILQGFPTAAEFAGPTASNTTKHLFEVSLRCLVLMFVTSESGLADEDIVSLHSRVVEPIAQIAGGPYLSELPGNAFELLANVLEGAGKTNKALFGKSMRSVAAHVLNYCETSVHTKFQTETKKPLLRFLDAFETFLLPDSLPNVAPVRRRLQRINVPVDKDGHSGSPSSISSRWGRLRLDIAKALSEPSQEDLKPLTTMITPGSATARSMLQMLIVHLRDTDLAPWVSVSLLLCLRYLLPDDLPEPELIRIQEELDALDATPLLSTLIEKPSVDVVRHAMKFGIRLLEGGNKKCQDTLLNYFKTHDEKFFLTIRRYLKIAQQEVSTMPPSARKIVSQSGSESDDDDDHGAVVSNSSVGLDLTGEDQPLYAAMSRDLCRLLQLLCEGHHFEFQNYVRHQNDNFNSYNMCTQVMELLHAVVDRMDPSTTQVAIQALNTLTEFCQGPCQLNQAAIVACNIVLEVNRILGFSYDDRFDEEDVMELKKASTVILLALLEGSQDASIPNLLLTTLNAGHIHQLVEHVWLSVVGNGGGTDLPKDEDDELLEVGFNVFILAKILISMGDPVKGATLSNILRDTAGHAYFNASICCIEIWRDDDPSQLRLESVYFRKPEICALREETKDHVMQNVDRTSLVAKHSDFCKRADDLIFEMEYQYQIDTAAKSIPKVWQVLTAGLLTCKPRPVENVLLVLGLLSNLMLIVGMADRSGPINWPTAFAFAIIGLLQFFCAIYLVVVRFILQLPRLAHRDFKKGEVDPFLSLKTWQEKVVHVGKAERVWQVTLESYTLSFMLYAVSSALGLLFSPFFYSFLLSMVTFKAPLLANIVGAISLSGRQLLLSAFLGVISVYFFSVIGYLFFHDHFVTSDGGSNCETLLQCFFYSFGQGVRGGGGIGEELITNNWDSADFFRRELYDTLFFVIVAVIVMNIVFALIVDTFAKLRDGRKFIEDDMKTTCFVCGIDAATFDREGEGFIPHTKGSHNVWQYLYFLHHLRRKEVCEYTGQESYVASKVNRLDLSFFPVNRSKSLIKRSAAMLADADEETAEEASSLAQMTLAKASAPSASSAGGLTAEDVRKIVREAMEEFLKQSAKPTVTRESTSTIAHPTSFQARRGSMLWAKARDRVLPPQRNENGEELLPGAGDYASQDSFAAAEHHPTPQQVPSPTKQQQDDDAEEVAVEEPTTTAELGKNSATSVSSKPSASRNPFLARVLKHGSGSESTTTTTTEAPPSVLPPTPVRPTTTATVSPLSPSNSVDADSDPSNDDGWVSLSQSRKMAEQARAVIAQMEKLVAERAKARQAVGAQGAAAGSLTTAGMVYTPNRNTNGH